MNAIRGIAAAWLTILGLAGCSEDFDATPAAEALPRKTSAWPHYGGAGGRHFVELDLLTKANVAELDVAWIHRTGDVSTVFQGTPLLAAGQLVLCTPHNQVVALDPLTGGERWRVDPAVARHDRYANEGNCRGVTAWRDAADPEATCGARILMATNDARLFALDARSGARCADFGTNGEVDLALGVGRIAWDGEYQVTSPPTVVGDLAVVGSSVSDNGRTDAPSGVVRAFDVRSGTLRWAFDLAPPDYDHATMPVSDAGWALGTPNVWAPMVADAERDLVFLPTGNPAPDYYRDGPADMDFYGSSVLALRASTGELVWQFRTVHDDFWDFDVPSQPVLAELDLGDGPVPALIQSTKMGHVFVLHRETGEPLVPVEYREVPRRGPLAEQLSPVQPFPPEAFRVGRDYVPGRSVLGLCDGLEAESAIGPLFTPVTEDWTVTMPGYTGATNWGGIAVDPGRGLIVVPTLSVPTRTRLISREAADEFVSVILDDDASEAAKAAARTGFGAAFGVGPDVEVALQEGQPWMMARQVFLDPVAGTPCGGTPFGELLVIDVAAGEQRWRRPHGTTRDVALLPLPTGMPGMGGPLLTTTGLLFMGGGAERTFRAYDVDTGEELWRHRLPEPGNATPMSYTVETPAGPKQFVVIAAGGDARTGIAGTSDHLVAFALPD